MKTKSETKKTVDRDEPALPPINDWDRQEGESHDAYESFLAYLDAGPTRSLKRAASKMGKSLRMMELLSAQYCWEKRAYRYDSEQDRLRLHNHRQRLDKMSDRHAKAASVMFKKIIDRIQSIDVSEISARDVAVWMKVIVELERHALGERLICKRRRGRPVRDDGEPIRFENGRWRPKGLPKPEANKGVGDDVMAH